MASRGPPRMATPSGARKAASPNKVFVGGLGKDCSLETFREYFERYGTLTDCVVMKDKVSGAPRGFGFVQYDDAAPVEAIIAEKESHQINGKWIEVKRCTPKESSAPDMAGMHSRAMPTASPRALA